ncbi:hypothetical protein QAD02_003412 [Eretmocerus hayati]|uniref:Uncharacterized protein n=1 Tax=Eretmocerus hayati TaxID=131215 RepID=A0ACC2NMV8_9HYME|nr:hypothetical protein QAD02_003412 [Eretmocerus hayati]
MAGKSQEKPKSADLPGFASARISIEESRDGLVYSRDLYTAIPRSWLVKKLKKGHPDQTYFLPGVFNEEVFDLFFTLARIKKHKPSSSWDVKPVSILLTSDTYKESLCSIKSLADNDLIDETRFGGRAVESLLSSVISVEQQSITPVNESMHTTQNQFVSPTTPVVEFYESFQANDERMTATSSGAPPKSYCIQQNPPNNDII